MSVSGLFRPGTCDVCSRNRDVAVCASVFGAISHAICVECLQRPAEPLSSFKYTYDTVGPDNVASWVRNWYTWIDGKYVHWDNYVWRRKNND
jgi:hypothetical protein